MGICSSDQEGPINPHQVDASHFSMMKVVGKGGFGKVNAVTHRISGRLMAMKRMKKAMLLKKKIYVVTAWRERDVMAKVKSPFLVNLEYAFQDKAFLYILMPFMQGGDLRYYLNTRGRMNEEICRFYAVEMILGLEELHSLNILYRDLKPDNVLFDSDGHLRVSDFGLAVFLRPEDDFKTQGAAGTPGYQAPEVLNRVPYGFSADVWSLAITIYELLEKSRPFHTQDDVLSGSTHLYFEERISSECKDFISRLLIRDPHKRYGCGKEGIAEIKRHPWFKGINWKEREEKKVSAPFLPDLDRANCSADFELADQFLSDKKEPDINEEDQTNFSGFEYNVNPPSGTTFEIPNEKKKKIN